MHTPPTEGTKISNTDQYFFVVPDQDNFLTNITITRKDVIEAVASLPSNTSAGDDGISENVIKKYQEELAAALQIMFNCPIKTGKGLESPYIFKIQPIRKARYSKNSRSSYHPVNLTSGIIKAQEKCVLKYIDQHIRKNNLIDPYSIWILKK